jgi:preprotein translocase subunit SecE
VVDKIKLVVAFLVVAAGVGVFYYFPDTSLLLRTAAVLLGVVLAAGIVFTTEAGKSAWHFVVGARQEVRKVVWPNRKETSQTTLVVIVMVIIAGIVIWLFDAITFWAVYDLLLGAIRS